MDWKDAALTAYTAILPGYEPTPEEAAEAIQLLRDYASQKECHVENLREQVRELKAQNEDLEERITLMRG